MTEDLKKAELAAHRCDGLGAPMTFYQPHVAALRAKAGLKDSREAREPVDEMLIATRETQGQPVDAEPRKELRP